MSRLAVKHKCCLDLLWWHRRSADRGCLRACPRPLSAARLVRRLAAGRFERVRRYRCSPRPRRTRQHAGRSSLERPALGVHCPDRGFGARRRRIRCGPRNGRMAVLRGVFGLRPRGRGPEEALAERIRPIFAWYDLWVGAFWDRRQRKLYVLPLPWVGVVIEFGSSFRRR